jgi:hypothetical protein
MRRAFLFFGPKSTFGTCSGAVNGRRLRWPSSSVVDTTRRIAARGFRCELDEAADALTGGPHKVHKRPGTAPRNHAGRCPETQQPYHSRPLPGNARQPPEYSGGLEVPSSNLGAPSSVHAGLRHLAADPVAN